MRTLGTFLLLAGFTLSDTQAFAESKVERQRAAVSRMVERSRPAPAPQRGPASMPARRQFQPQQQRAFRPDAGARSARMMDPDVSQPIRQQRIYDRSQFNRGPAQSPRVFNTVATEQQVQAPPVSTPRTGRTDGDRADRVRDWRNRNRDGRNRGGDVATAPTVNPETATGAVTTPTDGQLEGRRRWGDRDRDGDRRDGGNRNWDGNRDRGDRHGDANHHHGGNRHRNWHERHRDDPNFDRNHRRWHNREWWRRNYTRFALFGGGYYYWNSGYWYPAYGYHPSYSTYSYDAPLYGYNGLPPGQVIAMVQTQLQQRGYYDSAVDGTYGPRTEQALLNFQADAGISMTGEIDQDTLSALGFQ